MNQENLSQEQKKILGWLWALEASPRLVIPGPTCSEGYVSLKVLRHLCFRGDKKVNTPSDRDSFSESIRGLERQGLVRTQKYFKLSQDDPDRSKIDSEKGEIQLTEEGLKIAKPLVTRKMKRFIKVNKRVYKEMLAFWGRVVKERQRLGKDAESQK